jgi:hypothetical protein
MMDLAVPVPADELVENGIAFQGLNQLQTRHSGVRDRRIHCILGIPAVVSKTSNTSRVKKYFSHSANFCMYSP